MSLIGMGSWEKGRTICCKIITSSQCQQKRCNAISHFVYKQDTVNRRLNFEPNQSESIVKGVQKHSKSGAKISDIVEDITSYNIKSFRAVMLTVGGNDASSNTDIELFEEKYDQRDY